MEKAEILKKLEPIIKTYVTQPDVIENINEDSHLLRDLKINSAHLIDIVLDVESSFNISITDEEVEKMDTVGSAVELIQKKLISA